MNKHLLMVVHAGLLILIAVLGTFFLISLVFLIGFREWVNLPFFIVCFLAFWPLGFVMYKLRRTKIKQN